MISRAKTWATSMEAGNRCLRLGLTKRAIRHFHDASLSSKIEDQVAQALQMKGIAFRKSGNAAYANKVFGQAFYVCNDPVLKCKIRRDWALAKAGMRHYKMAEELLTRAMKGFRDHPEEGAATLTFIARLAEAQRNTSVAIVEYRAADCMLQNLSNRTYEMNNLSAWLRSSVKRSARTAERRRYFKLAVSERHLPQAVHALWCLMVSPAI